jgi:ABC-type Na+ efflux pump permease subunit
MDTHLPPWARRSNPVIRYELGQFWKCLLPDFGLLARLLGVQAGLMLVLPVPVIMTLTLPIAMLTVVTVPVLGFIYITVLVAVVFHTATAVAQDRERNMLDLLRVSPLPLTHITLGKVAAAMWRTIEALNIVLIGAVIFSLPVLVIVHLGSDMTAGYQLPQRVLAMLAVIALPLRLLLEPFFFAAMALVAGLLLPTRAAAVTVTLAVMVFYYVGVSVPLLANLTWAGRLLAEVVVPLALPVLGTVVCIWVTHRRVIR